MKGYLLVIAAGLISFSLGAEKTGPTLSRTKLDGAIMETLWCGAENEVVLIRTEDNSIYRSEDRGVSFKKITKHFQKAAERKIDNADEIGQVATISRTGKDEKGVLFIGTHGVAWFSANCGKSMRIIKHDMQLIRIKGHQTESGWYLAQVSHCTDSEDESCDPNDNMLVVTFDYGKSWKTLRENVLQWEWSFSPEHIQSGISENRVYVIVQMKNSKQLLYSDDWFRTHTVLIDNCSHFFLRIHFLYAMQEDPQDKKKNKIFVSTMQDKFIKFYPTLVSNEFHNINRIHILDTSENAAFVMVNHKGNQEFGNIFVSDSTGTRFSLSLRNVLRHPKHGADFVKVQGLEGIYVANVLDKSAIKEMKKHAENDNEEEQEWEDEEKDSTDTKNERASKKERYLNSIRVHTVISFNKGGSWRYLKPPKMTASKKPISCRGNKDCSLHLYLKMATTVPFYSHKNAHGIILANGNIGAGLTLQQSSKNIYLSRDGGLTWSEIAKGHHVYDMADHGGLLVMTNLEDGIHKRAEIKYSWDEGKTWSSIKLTKKNAIIHDIFTEPDCSTQHFLLQAEHLHNKKGRGVVEATSLINFNFENLHERVCTGEDRPNSADSDYETWSPYDGRHGQQCLMGRKITYSRRKKEAGCYNGVRFERPMKIENCECTEEDYECDYGFDRKDEMENSPCVSITKENYASPEVCPATGYYTISSGYRKIAGNTCVGGVQHPPFSVPCSSSLLMSHSGIVILILLVLVVVLLFVVGYTYQNFEKIRQKLQSVFKSSAPQQFTDVKYDILRANENDEELVMQATVPEEKVADK